MKLVTFDVASTFGFFRKNFTTTNALTYAMIPRSAVEGLIGAIIGLTRTNFPSLLESSKIAVQLMSPIRKLNMKYKHMNPKWWDQTLSHYIAGRQSVIENTREQITVPASAEFLVNPAYRIYVDTNNNEINKQLSQNLERKQCFYTPCLGGSSMIASLKYVGDFEYESVSSNGDYLPISSIIPFFGRMPKIKLEKNTSFATEEDLANHIDNERRSLGTYSVVYGTKPSKILVIDKDIVRVKNKDEDVYIKFI